MRRGRSVCALLCAGLYGAVARAQAPDANGGAPARVLRVDEDLIVFDGTDAVFRQGQEVRVLRRIEIRHPITGALLRDRYPLGVVTLHAVGAQLSVARLTEPLIRAPRAGDEVEALDAPPRAPRAPHNAPEVAPRVATARPAASAPQLPPPPPGAPREVATSSGTNGDDALVLAAWRETLGLAPEQRIVRWSRFLSEHPRTRHAVAVRAALAQLRGDVARENALASRVTSARPAAPPADAGPIGNTLGIPDLLVGDVGRFAMQLVHPEVRARGALFVRRRGAEAYESVPLVAQGDRYVVAAVPPRFVTAEGFEYFVSLQAERGEVMVMGSAERPRRVSVSPRVEDEPTRRGRTRIDLRGEYADVGSRTVNTPDGARFRAQRFYLVEGDFFQRLSLPALYGYRVGFGVYEGEGVALAEVDSAAPSTRSTVIYGYHELEFEVTRGFHVITRGALGVHGDGLVGGAQLRVRIGQELSTNLVLGGDLFNQIGQRAFFALNLNAHRRVPVLAQGEVFNQSFSGGDPMFRFIAQVGFRATSWLTLAARGSYQLRNIQNGGFGGGLSTTFDW